MATPDQPIVFISESRVLPGKAEGLRAFLEQGSKQLEAVKPQTLGFLAYLDETAMTLTIVHVFADAAGFDAHVAGADRRSAAAEEFIEAVAASASRA